MIEYELLNPLPRWCYTGSEWTEMIKLADKIIGDYMYRILEPDADELMLASIGL